MRSALVKLGRNPAVDDPRVPGFAAHSKALPPPPHNANWMADVPVWKCLANDNAGDCVPAYVMHQIMQQSWYLNPGKGVIPTDSETLALYSAVTGYDPSNPATDQGTYVLGDAGIMQYWLKHGVTCGGVLSRLQAYLALDPRNPTHIRQAVNIFGGVGVGINFPMRLMDAPELPFVWTAMPGPREGHEIFIPAYETVGSTVFYDLISWGENFRIPEPDLLQIIEEAVCVFSEQFVDARGVNAAGVKKAILLADMAKLHSSVS